MKVSGERAWLRCIRIRTYLCRAVRRVANEIKEKMFPVSSTATATAVETINNIIYHQSAIGYQLELELVDYLVV